MPHYIDTYYARTLANEVVYPTLQGEIDADVVVIGAGLAGVNTAFELTERGMSVVLVESGRIGFGASGRNGGFVIPAWAPGEDTIIKMVGKDHSDKLHVLIDNAVKTIRTRISDFKIDCGPITEGMLELALKSDEGITGHYRLRGGASPIEHLSREKVGAMIKSDYYGEGLLYKDSFHFHPLNYLRAIADRAVKKGLRIFEGSPVTSLSLDQPVKVVGSASGQIRAKHVVFACSGYIGNLYRPLSNAIVPVSTYVMATEPLGDRLKELIRVDHSILDTRFANFYYRPLADTRLLWGGRCDVFSPPADKVKKMLRQDMLDVFPSLADVKVEVAWGGYMGYSRHKMPQIGKTLDNVWHCTAFGGCGLASTTAGATVMANAIAGQGDEINLFKPFGLDFTGGPLLAPAVTQMMYWGYQALDKINALRA